jgi:hypothetical protein
MGWLVLITHQTQPEMRMLKYSLSLRSLAGEGAQAPWKGPRSSMQRQAAQTYLAASFCAAICPAAPSLSASFTLAHNARASSCLSSAT